VSGGTGALLVSPFNVKWRCSAQPGGVEESKFCLFSVVFPVRCVSGISPKFYFRKHALCFLPLATILESLSCIFFFSSYKPQSHKIKRKFWILRVNKIMLHKTQLAKYSLKYIKNKQDRWLNTNLLTYFLFALRMFLWQIVLKDGQRFQLRSLHMIYCYFFPGVSFYYF
jgi:hypothetical protein